MDSPNHSSIKIIKFSEFKEYDSFILSEYIDEFKDENIEIKFAEFGFGNNYWSGEGSGGSDGFGFGSIYEYENGSCFSGESGMGIEEFYGNSGKKSNLCDFSAQCSPYYRVSWRFEDEDRGGSLTSDNEDIFDYENY